MPTASSTPKPEKVEVAKKRKATAAKKPAYKCEFCGQGYKTEKPFLAHSCDKRTRYYARNEKPVRTGFWAYQSYYAMALRSRNKPEYDQFMKSHYYVGFVNFGRYIHHINAIDPPEFLKFLIKGEVPLDDWCKPYVYDTYVRELTKIESPTAAVERNFMLMQQWSIETGEAWTDFFAKIEPPRAVLWIKSGRISPWILYTAPSAERLFERFSDEQVSLIDEAINPDFWSAKLARHDDEVEAIRAELDAAGL